MVAPVIDRHIEVTPGIAGGKPHITGHRITVQNIALWHEYMSMSADEISSKYGLTLAEVYAALAYYFDNRLEIDRSIAEDNAFVEAMRRQSSSVLGEKLKALRGE